MWISYHCPNYPCKMCDYHLSIWEKFAHTILPIPSHPLYDDLSKSRSHVPTQSTFRSLPSGIAIHRNSVVLHLASSLTNWDSVSAGG